MRFIQSKGCYIVAMVLTTLLGLSTVCAREPETVQAANVHAAAPTIMDISLQMDGSLRGALIDATGNPIAGSSIWIRQQGQLIAESRTDERGQFAVGMLRGGVYEIATLRGGRIYRLWAHGTAPPSARSEVLLVASDDVVRGQQPGGFGPPSSQYFPPQPAHYSPPPPEYQAPPVPAGPMPDHPSLQGEYGYYAPTMAPLIIDAVNLGLGITGVTLGIIALSDDAS